MEEYFCTGYCKALDGSRTVTVEVDDGIYADCAYPGCPFADTCPIAEKIHQLSEE